MTSILPNCLRTRFCRSMNGPERYTVDISQVQATSRGYRKSLEEEPLTVTRADWRPVWMCRPQRARLLELRKLQYDRSNTQE
ncbi:hypothetical protein PIIN_03253 [Serendipita indica DSM 11827]|uniref:Uncharacterized protein n=1 Tax=Serendipita indica (strain DSM 11827) TaxID=1109443 RepID=G4TDF9_SERID|nr:hypothetical protein PIIN_03253 [Serendipita indica DSM 11827]